MGNARANIVPNRAAIKGRFAAAIARVGGPAYIEFRSYGPPAPRNEGRSATNALAHGQRANPTIHILDGDAASLRSGEGANLDAAHTTQNVPGSMDRVKNINNTAVTLLVKISTHLDHPFNFRERKLLHTTRCLDCNRILRNCNYLTSGKHCSKCNYWLLRITHQLPSFLTS